MPQLFQRVAAVTVDTVKVTGLRVQFKATKTLRPEPNTIDIQISNLAAQTRKQFQKNSVRVLLEAGYKGEGQSTSEQVFLGDARHIWSVYEQPDWVTHIQSGDSEMTIRNASISESFSKGARKADVLKKLMGTMKADVKDAMAKVSSSGFSAGVDQFAKGLTLHGNTARELTKILDSSGYSWSIQDGVMQILKSGETSPEPAIVLDTKSGLLGSPELGDDGYLKIKSLLQPGLKPGRKVILQSEIFKGALMVVKVIHSGDTHGPAWFSEIEAQPV
jgi:hypothetical protein